MGEGAARAVGQPRARVASCLGDALEGCAERARVGRCWDVQAPRCGACVRGCVRACWRVCAWVLVHP